MPAEQSGGSPPGRRGELLLTSGAAALLVAQQVASKATRDALFLSAFDPRRLPIVMASGALLSLFAVLAMARALAQQGPRRVMPWALLVNATAFAVEWIAHPTSRDGVAVALYLHVAALGSVLLSGFWSLVSERFDPHRARASVPRVAAGATFGGVLGGVVAQVVGTSFGARSTLLVLSITSALAAIALLRVGASAGDIPETRAEAPPETPSSLGVIARTPFLRSLAAMSMLVAIWEALFDFAFKARAGRVFTDEASLVTFFSLFYTVVSLLTFLLQSVLGRALLERLRVESSLRLLPVFVSATGLGLLFGAPFWVLGAVRGGESVLSNSIYRAAYELLFAPLPRETKRPTKTLVDVAATRVGDVLGSLLVLSLIQSWHGMPAVVPVVVAAGVALLSLLLVERLREHYVQELEAALRAGAVDLEAHAALDATTRRTLTEAPATLDHTRLLAEIDALRRASVEDRGNHEAAAAAAAAAVIAAQPGPQVEAEVPVAPPRPVDAALVVRFAALASGVVDRARQALAQPLEPALVPVALPLIAHPQLGRAAIEALRRVAPVSTGALVDALVDPRTPFSVRFRVPRVLRAAPTRRAATGLVAGLDDPRLEVRLQCARALVHLASQDPTLAPAEQTVFGAVERELAERGATWSAVATTDTGTGKGSGNGNGNGRDEAHEHDSHDDELLSLDELMRMRASRSLQYVLTLLSLVIDGEALQLALHGLASTEDPVRGTAIELLENVLPEPVRSSLVPVLESRGHKNERVRPREEIVAELLHAQRSLPRVRPRLA